MNETTTTIRVRSNEKDWEAKSHYTLVAARARATQCEWMKRKHDQQQQSKQQQSTQTIPHSRRRRRRQLYGPIL